MFYVSRYDGRERRTNVRDAEATYIFNRRPRTTAPTTTDDDRGRHPDDHGRLRRPSIRTTTVDTDISGRSHVGALLVWTLALSLSVVFFSLLSLFFFFRGGAEEIKRRKEKKRKEQNSLPLRKWKEVAAAAAEVLYDGRPGGVERRRRRRRWRSPMDLPPLAYSSPPTNK
jgi:hypothetical protein